MLALCGFECTRSFNDSVCESYYAYNASEAVRDVFATQLMSSPIARYGVRMLRAGYGPGGADLLSRAWVDLAELFNYVMGVFMGDLNGALRRQAGQNIPVSLGC